MAHYIDPDKATFALFKDLPRTGAIHMLNLVRFKETASYTDGTKATGKEAYATYSRKAAPVFAGVGGQIIWSGRFDLMLIGPPDEHWDACFIAQYPDANAFITMLRDPDYRAIVKHRQAAVQDSRLIRLAPQEAGAHFG